jgi:NAD-dependent deacetylase
VDRIDPKTHQRVVFFTGAGMSAESGVPTYRGQGGIWASYRFEDYACQEAFLRDPEGVWDFHDMRRQKTGDCEPHDGYELISNWEKENPNTVVITQNIDGLHRRSGSRNIFELHGCMWQIRCDACGVLQTNWERPLANRRHDCGAYWRPNIVWFGDSLQEDVISGALHAIRNCDLFISIGTSAVVMPAAGFPLEAKRSQAHLIEVNPETTVLSGLYDANLRVAASQALKLLLGLIEGN